MNVILKIKSDLLSEPDQRGRQKVLKRNIVTRAFILVEQIGPIMEMFNTRGTILKKECKIHIPDIGFIVVNHSFDYVKGLKDSINNNKKIGF